MWFQCTLALVGVALALAYYYFTMKFNYWRDKGVKFIKPYPILGSLTDIFLVKKHMMNFMQEWYTKCKDEAYLGFFQGRNPSLMIFDPEILKNIFIRDFNHFTDHGFVFDENKAPLEAKNLFNMEGERWKIMRAKLTPTFTSGRMKAMFPLVLECAMEVERHLDKFAQTNQAYEVKDLTSLYTTDVIGSCVFGVRCNSLKNPNSQFRIMGRRLSEFDLWRACKSFILLFVPELSQKLGIKYIDDETADFFRELVRNIIEVRAKTGETRKDFIQLLIELKNTGRLTNIEVSENLSEVERDWMNSTQSTNETKLTEDDVVAQAMVFFLAGFETSSSAMTHALLELAMNPDVQQRVHQEIDEVLQRHEGEITYQAIQEMPYLECVLKETLRKYPPLIAHARKCTKNYIIPGTKLMIDKDTLIMAPIYVIQNDPKYFPEPEKFDPERFSDKNKILNNSVYSPFGEGPRTCIGKRFALMQSKLGLISTLRKFTVHKNKRTTFPPVFDGRQIILTARDGIWLNVIPRNN